MLYYIIYTYKKVILFYYDIIIQIQMNPKIFQNLCDMQSLSMPDQTGLDSDKSVKKLRTYESTQPGDYKLSDRIYQDSCLMIFPGYNVNSNFGVDSNRVDIESEFRGLNYINSKCHDIKDDPVTKFKSELKKNTVVDTCGPQLIPEYTKNKRACSNISDIQQDRFDYPLYPSEVQSNDYIGSNTRQMARDTEALVVIDRNQKTKESCLCGTFLWSHSESDCQFVHDKNWGKI
jgi:hypothetical protein